ncbi:hypothetical protein QLS71_014540 [Mariniflexile litorale]|uniref:Uncharacterized protein n=1 Tax=Mariniflexile litorale TaxID=3045158 RepID=A0AAU7EDM9_9FLAO|nr:hypothetical protein [Mariniflexile sp. KMM 9835]MDQ8212857.1 hypothetical protein [Mariniflexile sp. KMM 9835]
MDELELLKKDWKKDTTKYPQLTYKEIYTMIHAKSSNIVKWIFIISLLEFGFWLIISVILKGTSISEKMNDLDIDHILIPLTIISYVVLVYFFYQFYINHKNISATDNSKTLIENILKTRQTVKQYVIFNLAFLVIGTFLGAAYGFKHDPIVTEQLQAASLNGGVFQIYAGVIVATIALLAIVVGLLLFIYWLTYGLLLKRLNRNYTELKKLEV